ncbi:MAG TPA: Ldh family oxidoreductase [Candidatus Methylomirabilis sp.]|nr:Ldh family oxidoreductase [Candidatus Methylomirabilis sp.]
MKRMRAEELQALVTSACEKMGARRGDAELVASLLVRANLCGYDSHGVFRLAQYHKWWKAGLLNPGAQPVIAEETMFAAKVDGQHAFGQVVAHFATRVAIDKARRSGIAVVTAKNSNHVGRLADYVETIQQAGLIGLAMVNDSGFGQFVVPWGGIDPRLATNPIAMGIPGGEGRGILFDFSTSATAMGKVRQLMLRGESAPAGWLIDATGTETTDPASLFREPRSSLLPAGGHRGFALSLVVEVLAGILSGAGFANPHPGPEEMNGIFVLAADVSWFVPFDQFRAQVDQLTAYMKTSRPMPGLGPVHIPGEKSRAEEARRRQEGIFLSEQNWERVKSVLDKLGVK